MALFDLFGIGQTPDYLSDIMSEEQRRKLQQAASQNALLQAGLGMLTQSGYSKTPVTLGQVLGAGGQAGLGAYQNTMQQGAQDVMTQQKFAEMKRQRDQQKQLDTIIAKLPEEEQIYARLAPEPWITGKMKPQTKAFSLLNEEQAKAYGLPTAPAGQAWQVSEKGYELVGAANKSNWSEPYTLDGQIVQKNVDTGEIRQAVTQPSSTNVSYGAPVAGVVDGKPVFFQPSKGGGAPTIIPNITPPEPAGAKPSEFESKAGLYFKSMRAATNTLNNLEVTNDRFMPTTSETLFDESTKAGKIALSKSRSLERKQYIQAQKQWIDSINRVRSGANLPEMEYNRAVETFFPQLNDPADLVEQKRLARAQEEEAMKVAAGKALQGNQGGSTAQGTQNAPTTSTVPAATTPSKPTSSLPKTKSFDIGGKKVNATLGTDGNYYVTVKGKRYKVEE